MRSRITMLSLAAIMASVLGHSAFAADKEIVAIYKSGTQQYFIDQADGFKKAAEARGYSSNIINVELDANRAISAVSDAIASGAKGIAITAPDQAIGPAVAKAASDAKVLLVATDDPLQKNDGSAVPFVGFDGTAMGNSVGEAAVDILKKSGWMDGANYGVLATEYQTVSVCNDRTNASRQKLEDAGVAADHFKVVAYDGTTDNALQAAGPVITANPGIDKWIVYACNDEGVLGATNALRNAGFNPEDVIGVGLGAYEACRPWQAGIATGFKAALYLSGADVGKAAANALIDAIEGTKPLPEKTVADTTIVTPDNYKDVMPCS
ncbi:substrate-binding domain-containing protein [Thalassospira marina]|uniref:Sugar ABC transporter substrate-binding protein n=1 Tax=Thalassospira marina TaxID=2048283 RepID=A0ABN5FLZ8_9PROT|nr:substrate-binding domain-containing protein [Thalassospira marina]AUG55756.1 sugar ABC transporter substrate-binding protein [Thalassospira marina]